MSYGSDKRLRNCGGKYPESHTAQKGYYVGPLRIYECPKTFIKKSSLEAIDAVDLVEKGLFKLDPVQTQAKIVEIIKTVAFERMKISEQTKVNMQSKAKARGS
jgi:hypothetical protein